ncbi:Rieske 2Fe-2S domain-containing protein [Streptomyces formicae]|uniref:cholesterol 7-desaturase n=1 Tax=Streptomyces formicae TaxID=1616117 RepID=A0A291QEQ0_9ACTN|nr:Rieske 2Fe-2S domain-containing protein [Streptomyces formicae]ATL29996.1 Phenylpropionate dioxygenase-related ring-hydroxylating dioxygenase, large terminal subunit [Streptomyces formicae]
MTMQRHTYPWGWYPVAFSRDVPSGKVITSKLADSEVVVYRTADGQAHVILPTCPHLGAHLGGGHVEGQLIVCPFHAFGFAPDGTCARTGYNTTPPHNARVGTFPTQEANGFVFAWYHEAATAPAWRIEQVDLKGFGYGYRNQNTFRGNQIDLLENGVDLGHFQVVHANQAKIVNGHPIEDDFRYVIDLELTGFYRNIPTYVRAEMYGLGYAVVSLKMPKFAVSAYEIIGYTPEGSGLITLRRTTVTRCGSAPGNPAGRHILRVVSTLVGYVVMRLSTVQGNNDIRIWDRRVFIERPKLAQGDGPIMPARKWAEKFHH